MIAYIHYSFSGDACRDAYKNNHLTDITSRDIMEANGWVFENLTSNISYCMPSRPTIKEKCRGENGTHWYGWGCGKNVGAVSITFKGSGTATLNYGNCWDSGRVNVYLNNVKVSYSLPGTTEMYRFPYNDGNELKIMDEEGNAIINIFDITFNCKGN